MILYDTGWKQQDYLKMTNSVHWAPLPDQLKLLGIQRRRRHQDRHRPRTLGSRRQISDFPNAVLYVQREELEGIEWALNYPGAPHRRRQHDDGRLRPHPGLRL